MAGVKKQAAVASPVRRKQIMILIALSLVIGVVAFVAAFLGTPKTVPPPRAPESTRKAFGAIGEQVNNADIWRTQEGARVTQLQQQLDEIQARLAANEKAAADARAQDAERQKKEAEERAAAAQRAQAAPPATGLPMQDSAQLGAPDKPDFTPQSPVIEPIKGIMRIDLGSGASSTQGVRPGQPGQVAQSATAPAANGDGQNVGAYIPAGSFMRGVLLSGLDAPTGGQSQQNPHPVIIEVLDMASLPNKFKADYKHCRLTANGVGDLSSERAYIRLDRLSCVAEDGGALDVDIKGYVADSTGKAGVRGRLVSKQGQVLANSLLAGVASGIGTAFAQNYTTTSISPLGSTSTVKDGEQLKVGAGQGVGTALQQLSRYYIQLAEKMFPIIEVDAGLPVDVVITRGLSIGRK